MGVKRRVNSIRIVQVNSPNPSSNLELSLCDDVPRAGDYTIPILQNGVLGNLHSIDTNNTTEKAGWFILPKKGGKDCAFLDLILLS